MSSPAHSPGRLAWRGACNTCKAFFQCFYSAFVLILFCVTAFAAYVASLDDIPVPKFIIHEIHDELKTKGLTLRMDGIRFQPNGRVIVVKPQLYSPELGTTVITADKAIAKVKLARLLLGRFALDEIRLSGGRFTIPAMLTPTGMPSTAVQSINLEAKQTGALWRLQYANLAIDNLKLSVSGNLKEDYLRPQTKADEEPMPSMSELIVRFAPKVARLQEELKRFARPTCIIELDINELGQQEAALKFEADVFALTPKIRVAGARLVSEYRDGSRVYARFSAESLSLPQEIELQNLALATSWDRLPSAEDWMPGRLESSATQLTYKGVVLPSLVAQLDSSDTSQAATIQLTLADAPIAIQLERDKASQVTRYDLLAQLDPSLPSALDPIAQAFAQIDISDKAELGRAIDLRANGAIDADLKPQEAFAVLQSGGATVLGATIEHSNIRTRMLGPQINVDAIRVHSGKQFAEVKIGYNLETMLRRILVEGNVDPTLVNGWFKPWWTAMWDGMEFPAEGMYATLDSQATFRKPETVRVTGFGFAHDMNLRGMQVEDLRTRFFARFRYVDLYDLELTTRNGQRGSGDVQFSMGRDQRDGKDKLTGLWIEAVSSLDVMKGPELIPEIGPAITKILAPYSYQIPPLIAARSSSVRREDIFEYDIDLEIDTPYAFAFHGFPFDSLRTSVHLQNDIVDIPNAEAKIGDGSFETSAFIRGEDIYLTARLEKASFGETLEAANAYFAANGSEAAQKLDAERLLAYGGSINASFEGSGVVGDTLSYQGEGKFDIHDADFGKFQLFGLLSMALEATPLGFTTLKFESISGPFTVEEERIHFSDTVVDGPMASIHTDGHYNIESEALDFRAKLHPFRNSRVPLISPLLNIPLNIVSNVFEVSVTGTLSDPKLRLFNPSTREGIDVDKSSDPRQHRPAPR